MEQPLWRTVWSFLKIIKIELVSDLTISLLGKYSEKSKTLMKKDTYTPVFIAALFTIAKIWKQAKCHIYMYRHIYTHWNITQP